MQLVGLWVGLVAGRAVAPVARWKRGKSAGNDIMVSAMRRIQVCTLVIRHS